MADTPKALVITVAAAGTATQVDTIYVSVGRVIVRNPYSNTGKAYLGGPDLDATHRISLQVGEERLLTGIDLTKLYVTTEINGETVEILWFV